MLNLVKWGEFRIGLIFKLKQIYFSKTKINWKFKMYLDNIPMDFEILFG